MDERTVLKMNMLGGCWAYLEAFPNAYKKWCDRYGANPTEEQLLRIASHPLKWRRAWARFEMLICDYELT